MMFRPVDNGFAERRLLAKWFKVQSVEKVRERSHLKEFREAEAKLERLPVRVEAQVSSANAVLDLIVTRRLRGIPGDRSGVQSVLTKLVGEEQLPPLPPAPEPVPEPPSPSVTETSPEAPRVEDSPGTADVQAPQDPSPEVSAPSPEPATAQAATAAGDPEPATAAEMPTPAVPDSAPTVSDSTEIGASASPALPEAAPATDEGATSPPASTPASAPPPSASVIAAGSPPADENINADAPPPESPAPPTAPEVTTRNAKTIAHSEEIDQLSVPQIDNAVHKLNGTIYDLCAKRETLEDDLTRQKTAADVPPKPEQQKEIQALEEQLKTLNADIAQKKAEREQLNKVLAVKQTQ